MPPGGISNGNLMGNNTAPLEKDVHPWVVTGVLCLVFLFPIVGTTIKDSGSAILALLFLISIAHGFSGWREIEKWEQQIFIGFLIFFSIMLVSLVNTENPGEALPKFERFARFVALLPIYLFIRRQKIALVKPFMLGVIVSGFVFGIHAWLQVSVYGYQSAQGAYHKIVFGDIAVLVAGLNFLAVIYLAQKPVHYVLMISSAIFAIYASVMSYTRISWLLLPTFVLLWLWTHRHKINAGGWKKIGGGLLVGVMVFATWQPQRIMTGFHDGLADLQLFSNAPQQASSWGDRLHLWKDSLIIFQQSPLLGTGVGDFRLARHQLAAAEGRPVVADHGHAHSIYFHAIATTGLLGLTALVLFLLYMPYRVFSRRFVLAINAQEHFCCVAGLSCVFAFAFFGLTEAWLSRNPLVNPYIMCLLVFMSSIAPRVDALTISNKTR